MKKAACLITLLCLTTCVWCQDAPASRPADPRELADKLAAESLRDSAISLLHSPADTPGRIGRVKALLKMADLLKSGDPETNLLLADIYLVQGKLPEELSAMEAYMAEYPHDFSRSQRWLELKLKTFNTSEEKIEFLAELEKRKDLLDALKAKAMGEKGRLFYQKFGTTEAMEVFTLALRLDPNNNYCLQEKFGHSKANAPADTVKLLVGTFRSSPRDIDIARSIGELAGSLGLYKEELQFYDYARTLDDRHKRLGLADYQLRMEYLNALLDAGEYKKAIDQFEPLLEQFANEANIRLWLIEAYRELGQTEKADQLAASTEKILDPEEKTSDTFSINKPKILSHFYLLTKPELRLALGYALKAERSASDDPVVIRLLGAAMTRSTKSGEPAEGAEKLKPLADKDAYAAAFLAEYYFSIDDEKAAKKAIADGATLSRNGAAFRYLASVAKKHKVDIPPAEHSKDVAEIIANLDKQYLDMGLEPEKFVEVTLKPVKDSVAVGEIIELEASLKNIGPIDIPTGLQAGGLFAPSLALRVTVDDVKKRNFSNLPSVIWAAPRYLPPGKTIKARVRIDTGTLGKFLAERPFQDISLNVTALLSPVQHRELIRSDLPTVKITPVTIVRRNLMGQFDRDKVDQWPQAYKTAMGGIVSDLRHGKLSQRIVAARQVGSLLAFAQQVHHNKQDVPVQLRKVFSKPLFLRMMITMLDDPSDVVQAEVLASLNHAQLDESIIKYLGGPLIENPSPLVRMRLIEVLGASGTEGQETMIDYFSNDPDDMVKLMARSFQKKPEPAGSK